MPIGSITLPAPTLYPKTSGLYPGIGVPSGEGWYLPNPAHGQNPIAQLYLGPPENRILTVSGTFQLVRSDAEEIVGMFYVGNAKAWLKA